MNRHDEKIKTLFPKFLKRHGMYRRFLRDIKFYKDIDQLIRCTWQANHDEDCKPKIVDHWATGLIPSAIFKSWKKPYAKLQKQWIKYLERKVK